MGLWGPPPRGTGGAMGPLKCPLKCPMPASLRPQGSNTEELLRLTVNPNEVCGLGGHLSFPGGHLASPGGQSPQDASPAPQQPAESPPAALYEVVCDLSTPLHASVVSIQLGQWGSGPPHCSGAQPWGATSCWALSTQDVATSPPCR